MLLLPVVSVQPSHSCHNRNKESNYRTCHRTLHPFSWRFGSNSIIACSKQKWYNIINCQEYQKSPAACWDKTHNVEEIAEGTRM